ncbi:unnamed protein product [Penicillium olsonii]|uniref:NmrA-like domain-containing protein n=1 Tax=Penicillium olsonii TaxID=99116 RepID=A0A9W4I0R0_PENOL|nr:unnamed protein product [Penicillium olsonii]CAG8218423.1 unnamed protein product [Penicillium olsonii]CAG8279072.1 unnamed protein product [Penicillium olsonii]
MINVAIAGGTGGVGRTIVEVMQKSPHHPFVLTRSESNQKDTIQVDYNDIDSLVSILERHKIHTVISAFAVEGDSLASSQMNLIKAATKSRETRRFIPSGYAIPYPQSALGSLPQLKDYFAAMDALRESGLEWTVFHNGIFLDYFGTSAMKSYLKPNVFVIDIENKAAAIPGDGNVLVSFIYTFDLARYIVAALDLEKWDEETRVAGDEMTWNKFLALAEKYRGSQFVCHYDDAAKLEKSQITELPGHRKLYEHFPKESFQWFMSIFERFTIDGTSHIKRSGSLNEKFPTIRPLSVEGLLARYWGPK